MDLDKLKGRFKKPKTKEEVLASVRKAATTALDLGLQAAEHASVTGLVTEEEAAAEFNAAVDEWAAAH